ncbi:MFS general substrate transporter [Teratosphaeria nubilosa]|uniref:MFS general substrate transporter n=1 Tax=Teratosphaeria nubilosa TaxID=161662 RepID=A0A6G1L513_9PEZI|nr:MFS general substrate transporter [Teratosphaeria nubilosa]
MAEGGREHQQEELAGTTRLITEGEGIALVPEPTDSPNDPLNWSPLRKYWHASLVLFITALTAATSNDAGSAGDAMDEYLDISYGVQNTAAGVLFLAIGYWCLLGSPLTTLYGSKIMYLVCLLSSLGGSIWFARVETKQDAIWCQLFVGASESCAEALVQLSLSALFFQHQRGTVLGIYILATSIGTFLGPLIAGYIAATNWRWVGWSAAIVTAVTLIVFLFGLEETQFDRTAIIGRQGRRAVLQSSGEKSVDPEASKLPLELQAAPKVNGHDPIEQGSASGEQELPKSYWRSIQPITPAPNLVGTGLKQYGRRLVQTVKLFYFPAIVFSGLQWGLQDAWLSFYLTVEEDNWYNAPWYYTDAAVSIMNVPTLIGATIGCIYGGWFSDIFVRWMAKRRGGVSEAEDRLWLLLPSAIINPIGLILFGVGSGKGWRWPVPYVGLGFIGFGWGCAGDLSMAYLMDAYPDIVLEGMVGVAVINNSLAAVFTFVCSYWLDASGLASTFVAIGILSLVFQMLTLPMIYWGKMWRRKTATAYGQYLYIRDG